MRFKVPQFTEIEDKIVGPLTLKQFIYLAGGAGICAVIYKLLPQTVAFIVIAPVALLSLALAFVKINERPFIFTVEAFFKYIMGNKLYIWQQKQRTPTANEKQNRKSSYIPKISNSKLQDMKWTLNVKDTDNYRKDDN